MTKVLDTPQRRGTVLGRPRSKPRQRHHIDHAILKQRYLDALPKYFTPTAALASAGAYPNQLAVWREQDGEFCVKEQQARDQIADQLEGEAIRRAFRGVKTPVYQGGLLAGYITQYSDQLLTLMLKALRPEKFRERAEVQVSQPIIKVVAGFDPAEAL